MKITLIAAMDQNQLIGNENDLPWHIPADLKFFKEQTMGKTLLMGRKTCESLPFALPKRRNIVLSRNKNFARKGFEVIDSIKTVQNTNELMVIGGAKIYALMLPYATHMILTKIHATFIGDTHFPEVNWQDWQINRITNNPKSESTPDFEFDFLFYEKINPGVG